MRCYSIVLALYCSGAENLFYMYEYILGTVTVNVCTIAAGKRCEPLCDCSVISTSNARDMAHWSRCLGHSAALSLSRQSGSWAHFSCRLGGACFCKSYQCSSSVLIVCVFMSLRLIVRRRCFVDTHNRYYAILTRNPPDIKLKILVTDEYFTNVLVYVHFIWPIDRILNFTALVNQ